MDVGGASRLGSIPTTRGASYIAPTARNTHASFLSSSMARYFQFNFRLFFFFFFISDSFLLGLIISRIYRGAVVGEPVLSSANAYAHARFFLRNCARACVRVYARSGVGGVGASPGEGVKPSAAQWPSWHHPSNTFARCRSNIDVKITHRNRRARAKILSFLKIIAKLSYWFWCD